MNEDEYKSIFKHEDSHWWYVTLHNLVRDFLVRQRGIKTQPLNIIDIGCGTGKMMEISTLYGNVCGLDNSLSAVNFSKARGLKNIYLQDINSWSSKPGIFSTIICLDVLYHNSINSDANMLEKFYEALDEGGLCIINLPAFPILKRGHDEVVHAKKRYTKSQIMGMLKNSKFTPECISYRMPIIFIVIVISKLIRIILGVSQKGESDLTNVTPIVNKFLIVIHRFENWVINNGINLPFGSSIFFVLRK
jgi:2-polyprenyl-3-methyl-5-hydroxy-6-metoxy-1,4-benzoquinol methylase